MPIKKEELDKIQETNSIIDRMEPGLFYSFYEMSAFLLKEKIPEGKNEILESFRKGKKKISSHEAMMEWISLQGDVTYTFSVLYTMRANGELIMGRKEGLPYFARA